MSTEIVDVPAESRYVLLVDGERCGYAEYELGADSIRFTHTVVDKDRRGEGLGEHLVRGTLDAVRSNTDLRVIPICPFMDSWINDHPEYQELEQR